MGTRKGERGTTSVQGCPLISLPGRWHQSCDLWSLAGGRGLCQPTRYPSALPTPFPTKACTCHGRVGGGCPPILGFLPAPDFSSGRKEGDAALFCATGCWHLLFCLLQSVPCLVRAVGSRYLTEDKALVWNLGSDFDQLGELGQLT